jgi:hypothetical protein
MDSGTKAIPLARNLPRSTNRGHGPRGSIRGFPRCARCTSGVQIERAECPVERGGAPNLAARRRDGASVAAPRQTCRRCAAIWHGHCVIDNGRTVVAVLQRSRHIIARPQKWPSPGCCTIRPCVTPLQKSANGSEPFFNGLLVGRVGNSSNEGLSVVYAEESSNLLSLEA